MILLDHNAGAPMGERAREALVAALASGGANPSSVHGPGRVAREVLERARERVAKAVGARTGDVVFTSGATESVHLAIRGVRPGPVVATDVEHPAVLGALEASGRTVVHVGVREIDSPVLEAALAGAVLLTLPLGGHETGDLLPVAEIARRARAKGALVHADAAQALGRVPVDVGALGVDLLSLSAHKCGGPPGAGALWVRPGVDLAPVLGGGGQERGRRGGTEAWPLQAAFGVACEELTPEVVGERGERMAAVRDHLEARATTIPGAAVNGLGGARLPNTTSVSFEGVDGHELVIALDLRGYAVSSGSACASGLREPSPVVGALHPEAPWRAKSALRISIGPTTTDDEIARFCRALAESVALLRADSRVGGR